MHKASLFKLPIPDELLGDLDAKFKPKKKKKNVNYLKS